MRGEGRGEVDCFSMVGLVVEGEEGMRREEGVRGGSEGRGLAMRWNPRPSFVYLETPQSSTQAKK